MKKIFIYLFILFTAIGCSKRQEKNSELNLKSDILKAHQSSLSNFINVADLIDSDTESYFAYNQADSIINTIDLSGKNYYQDLSKIYSAYTYVFYGMSYTRAIHLLAKQGDYSLEELINTIIYPDNNAQPNRKLIEKELAALYSIINFYKASSQDKYPMLLELYNANKKEIEALYQQNSEINIYKTASLKNKKLFFKIIISLIIDIYFTNNPAGDETLTEIYFANTGKKGETLDKIPDDFNSVSKLSDKEYFENFVVCTKIQGEMLDLLTNEIKTLAKNNQ